MYKTLLTVEKMDWIQFQETKKTGKLFPIKTGNDSCKYVLSAENETVD